MIFEPEQLYFKHYFTINQSKITWKFITGTGKVKELYFHVNQRYM